MLGLTLYHVSKNFMGVKWPQKHLGFFKQVHVYTDLRITTM